MPCAIKLCLLSVVRHLFISIPLVRKNIKLIIRIIILTALRVKLTGVTDNSISNPDTWIQYPVGNIHQYIDYHKNY